MPTISMFYGIIIRMYYAPNEHPPPHFHVYYWEYRASVDIQTCEITQGKLPKKQSRLGIAWAELHQEELTQSRDWLPANIGAVCWRSMTTPCTSVYVPWYLGNTEVPPVYQRGKNTFTPNSAYWAFRSLSKAVDTDYGDTIAEVREGWCDFEKMELKFQNTVEQIALGLFEQDPDMANAFLTEYTMMQAQKVYKHTEQLTSEVEQP